MEHCQGYSFSSASAPPTIFVTLPPLTPQFVAFCRRGRGTVVVVVVLCVVDVVAVVTVVDDIVVNAVVSTVVEVVDSVVVVVDNAVVVLAVVVVVVVVVVVTIPVWWANCQIELIISSINDQILIIGEMSANHFLSRNCPT